MAEPVLTIFRGRPPEKRRCYCLILTYCYRRQKRLQPKLVTAVVVVDLVYVVVVVILPVAVAEARGDCCGSCGCYSGAVVGANGTTFIGFTAC